VEEAARVGAEIDFGAGADGHDGAGAQAKGEGEGEGGGEGDGGGAQHCVLPGSERLLRRALRNLLENARRYGGDDVLVQLRPLPGGGVEVAVSDRGPGVPESFRERIFEPFFRLPGHAEQAGGVGLGLSLVRQIASRHGGSVRCEARPGGGSRFVLTLPAA
jgi:signal transduction histidine kinase